MSGCKAVVTRASHGGHRRGMQAESARHIHEHIHSKGEGGG